MNTPKTKLSKLALFVLALSVPALTACVSNQETAKQSNPSLEQLANLEKQAIEESKGINAQSFNALPVLAPAEMTQPSNLKQECKLPILSKAEAKTFDKVYWDGKCQDGFANGLGRLILMKNKQKVQENLYRFDLANPNAYLTLYFNQTLEDNKPLTTTVGKMSYSLQGETLVPVGMLELIPNVKELALSLRLQGNIDPLRPDSMQNLISDEVTRSYAVQNVTNYGTVIYSYNHAYEESSENSKDLNELQLHSLILKDKDDSSQSFDYVQNGSQNYSVHNDGEKDTEISLQQDFADYVDSKMYSANKLKAIFIEEALGPRWGNGFTAAYDEYTSQICKKGIKKWMDDRNYSDICSFKDAYLARAMQIAKLRHVFATEYNLEPAVKAQEAAEQTSTIAKKAPDYDFFGAVVMLNRAR